MGRKEETLNVNRLFGDDSGKVVKRPIKPLSAGGQTGKKSASEYTRDPSGGRRKGGGRGS